MIRCPICKIKYPDHLVTIAFSSERGYYKTCPICALKVSNADLGVNRSKFDGEIAEDMRQQALEFRRKINQSKQQGESSEGVKVHQPNKSI